MSEYEALLTAIRTNPREDTPRLALADWLDERGHHERAEFIRVQVESARLEFDPTTGGDFGNEASEWARTQGPRFGALSRREDRLRAIDRARGKRGFLLTARERAMAKRMARPPLFCRGFMSALTVLDAKDLRRALRFARTQPLDLLTVCPRLWVRHAKKVLALHPDPLVSFASAPLLASPDGERVGVLGGAALLRLADLAIQQPSGIEIVKAVCAAEWPGVRFDWGRSRCLWQSAQ